jgi:uncharacterized membrane protein YdjX (TVP38/TMEM64 family)
VTQAATPAPGLPWRSIGRASLLLLGLLAVGLALRQFSGGLDAALMDRWVTGQGIWGQAVFILLGAAACATGVPRQAVGFAAGYAFASSYGLGLAIAIATVAQVLGCATDFYWARAIARDWARQRIRGRLARLEAVLAQHAFTTTLIVRLLPVGNNLAFSLLGGVSSVRALPFLVASAIGYVPQTLVSALLGGGSRSANWQGIALGCALFAGSVALGLWLYRRQRTAAALSAGS